MESRPRPLNNFTITFDRARRALLIRTGNGNSAEPLELFISDNGRSAASVARHGGLPIVHDVELYDERRFSLIEDWITDALAAALGEQYDDNYVYGVDYE